MKKPRSREEDLITAAVIEHWKVMGLPGTLVAGIPNRNAFGQAGLTRGLADLVVMTPDIRCGFIELKTDKGRLSDEQEDFRDICLTCGTPWAMTRGRDEPIAVLERWGAVRPQAGNDNGRGNQ